MSDEARRRVLFVVDAFPVAGSPADGVFLRDQAKALASRADVGVVIGRTRSPRQLWARHAWMMPDTAEDVDGFVTYVNESFVPTTRSTRLLVQARCRAVERAVRSFEQRFGRPDVIHAHCAAFAGETAVRVGRSLGIPVVITEHYSFLASLVETYGDRLLNVYDEADEVLAVSRSQAHRMIELGVRRPVRCMPNAVDTDAFAFEPIAPPADGVWKLLCVARDHEVKDLPTLLRAAAQLRDIRCEVGIVGSGDYREARSMVETLGLGNQVRFVGALARAELARMMKASHLIVSSSRIETFGMTLAESLCVGRPVVTTDSGGPRDIVRPQDGRIVPVGDASALANAIADVAGRYREYDQAALAASARERCGAAAFAERMLELYDEVLTGTRPAGERNAKPSSVQPLDAVRTTIVIATRNRPGPLAECLESLSRQTLPPGEIIVADASTDDRTRDLVERTRVSTTGAARYLRCRRAGAAAQRNEAIDLARGDVVFFLDDDVVCEPAFVEEVVRVLAEDTEGEIGGVSGTIVNQTFAVPSRLSRAFMRWMAGRRLCEYGGRLIGPAWNLLPPDGGRWLRTVDWLPSGCVAYRAEVLRRQRFNEAFGEYSFAEDVHLSARVGRTKRLVNTRRARLFHHDLGSRSDARPSALGRAQVVNRWIIMRDVLGRTGWCDRLKLVALQAYFGLAELRACLSRRAGWWRTLRLWAGRIAGIASVLCDIRRHQSTARHRRRETVSPRVAATS